MGTITYERIKLVGGFGISSIHEMKFVIEANQHAYASIVGVIGKNKFLEDWNSDLLSKVMKIMVIDDEGEETPLFTGLVNQVSLFEENDYCYAKIELKSGTIALDREKKSRSFQDSSLTYEALVKEVIKNTPHAVALIEIGEDTAIKKPLIQYMETDWMFSLRLASHFQSVLYPDVKEPDPRFWFGFPDIPDLYEEKTASYSACLSQHYYELGGSASGFLKTDFINYRIQTYANYGVGAKVRFDGQVWRIGRKEGEIRKNELIFQYTLCKPELVATKKQYNSYFTGMTLLGTVLSASSETLKLHLDIDKSQSESSAYAYQWTPDTGSTMYCMPKVGTTVSLYFKDEDEQSGRAVNCIRSNGSGSDGACSCPGMSDPNNRCLSTEHGKEMFLNPSNMGFKIEESGNSLILLDDVAVAFESRKKIEIHAEKAVKFAGKKIVMETPVNLNLKR